MTATAGDKAEILYLNALDGLDYTFDKTYAISYDVWISSRKMIRNRSS